MIQGSELRNALISGANNITRHKTQVDELNIFPVPDGDTGTNMSMTIGAARTELENMADTCTAATPASFFRCCSAVSPRVWPERKSFPDPTLRTRSA